MTNKIILGALAGGLILSSTAYADTPMPCGKREDFTAKLEKQYGEVRRGMGLAGGAAMFEVWTNGDSGSWTILMTRPDGVSCIFAAGEEWHDVIKTAKVGDPT